MEYLRSIYKTKAALPKYALAGTIPAPATIQRKPATPLEVKGIKQPNYAEASPVFNWTRQGKEAPTGPSPLDDIRAERMGKIASAGKVGAEIGGQLAGSIIDNSTTSMVKDAYGNEYAQQSIGGGIASGAVKGASMGMTFGPYGALAGALIGGAYGGITANKQKKENSRHIAEVNLQKNNQSVTDAIDLNEGYKASGFKSSGVMYPYGGNVSNPEYEVEGNEVVQGNDTQLENQEDLASDMTKAIGPTHADGGVEGQGGQRVFSDRLYPDNQLSSYLSAYKIHIKPNYTYANVAEKLGKLKGKYEEKLESHNPSTYNTGKAMTERMDYLIETVFQFQELTKQQDSMKTKYPYGGKLVKAADEFITPEQGINAAVYLSNLKNANKQVTNINRTTATPVYNKSVNFAKKAIYDAKSTGRNINTTIKNSSGNLQDYYNRLSDITGNVMQATNDANQKQAEMDMSIQNQNNVIKNAYRSKLAENANADMLDRATGRNIILSNKQAASNAFIQGVSANAATRKAEKVEMAKMELTNKLMGNRGIDDRLYKDMQEHPEKYQFLGEYLPKKAKGGTIKRKPKTYC